MKKILIVFAAALAVLAVEAQGQRRPSGAGPAQQPRGQMTRPSGRGGDRGARSRPPVALTGGFLVEGTG